jgi:Putative addiction module component
MLESDKSLGGNDPMLTLDQLIAEATALPDAAKAILIDKIIESMVDQIDQDLLIAGVKKAQERMAEIDSGAVQTIPGDITQDKRTQARDIKTAIALAQDL